MTTLALIRIYKATAAKPTPRSHGQAVLREWLLRELEQEIRSRAQVRAAEFGIPFPPSGRAADI